MNEYKEAEIETHLFEDGMPGIIVEEDTFAIRSEKEDPPKDFSFLQETKQVLHMPDILDELLKKVKKLREGFG